MKKKMFALFMTVVMALGMAVNAFAATGSNDNTGSITIDKAHTGATYSVYQILMLESYDTSINSYIYEPVDAWENWIKDATGGGQWLTLNDNGTVKWNGTATAAAAEAFVAAALDYAKTNDIDADEEKTKDADDTVVKFENLNLGYYLVDSSVGAICSLDTVMPNTIIEEKNVPPTNDKKVKDAEGNWQESISQSIGKTVEFASKLTIYPGTENLKYIDTMQNTLDLVTDSIKVYYTPIVDGNEVEATNYTVKIDSTENGKDLGKDNKGRDITFIVEFHDDFMATITDTDELTVVYSAVLNENAVIGAAGNLNDSMLTYGDDGETEWDDAKVYTYKFGIVKTDISNHILEGAEFQLYYQKTDGHVIPLIEDTPTWAQVGITYYRPATAAEQATMTDNTSTAEVDESSAVIKAGKACVYGIRSGLDMYLQEVTAPKGYNPLAERFHITALTGDNVPTFTAEGMYEKGGVEIENLAGAQLPQTGGMGTTLFYVCGGVMVAAAVVLLVTKKRMNSED